MIIINERICVIDGWIVDLVIREVVSKKHTLQFITADEKRELAKVKGLKVFKDFETTNTVLIESFSEELFKYIKTENVQFVTLAGRVVRKDSGPHKRAKKSVTNETTHLCHEVKLGARNKGYIHLVPPQPVCMYYPILLNPPQLTKTWDNSIFTKIIKVHEFNFTKEDHSILSRLVLKNDTGPKQIAGKMMTILKVAASKKAVGYFTKDFHGRFTNFIKDLNLSTLAQYGSRISFTLLLLECCDEISIFDNHSETAKTVADRLKVCETPSQKAEAMGNLVSGLSEGTGDTEFWMKVVFLGAFDFAAWGNYKEECPCVPVIKYRYFLDSIMWLFRYGGVLYLLDKEVAIGRWTATEAPGTDFVGNIKKLYYSVSKEADTVSETAVRVTQMDESVLVKDRHLSFSFIGCALKELTASFDSNVKKLSQWVKFSDFNQFHFDTIGAPHKSFHEDHSKNSLLENFSGDELIARTFRWRDLAISTDEKTLKDIKNIVGILNQSIMVMVWMSTGMPMRFPELCTLSFAGKSRNIYIDPHMRRLFLNVKYNKNGKFTNRILFMTDGVSRRLWWTITLLRLFILSAFENEIGNYDKKVFIRELTQQITQDIDDDEEILQDEDILDENIATSTEFINQFSNEVVPVSNAAGSDNPGILTLGMFAFVDIHHRSLFKLKYFNNMLKSFPEGRKEKEKHSISTWRQGAAALWKHFIISRVNVNVDERVASGFGHTPQTLDQSYGVDKSFTGGSDFNFIAMSTACRLFHEAIGHTFENDNKIWKPFKMADNPMDGYDLVEAGKRYFDSTDFDYKSQQQMLFTTMVLASDNRKVAGLQAPTAFGKSLTFTLPMMVLKQRSKFHYVSFVCVPYEALKIATIKKLEKGGLIARDIGRFTSGDNRTEVASADVFVGCLESFKNGKMEPLIKRWEQNHGSDTKLGYLVFDEAHTLFLEASFRPSINNIKGLFWEKWKKTLFLSATMDEHLFNKIMKQREIPDNIKQSRLFVNVIDELPAVNIESNVESFNDRDITAQTTRLIKNFLNNTANSKAVFFFSSKKRLHNVYRLVGGNSAVGMVDGDCLDHVKQEIFNDFEDEFSSTRIVLGTKLLSNGLDCKTVQFICLVDCDVNCIDYLQMVGRIRNWGYVKVLTVAGKKPNPTISEINSMFSPIDWTRCVSESVADFYNIPFEDHDGCCNVIKGDARIEAIKKLVERDETQGPFNEADAVVRQEDNGTNTQLALSQRVQKLLLRGGSNTLLKTWKHILGEVNCSTTQALLLNVPPKHIVTWDDDISSTLCDNCLMRKHNGLNCTPIGKIIGDLVYEYLAIQKIVRDKEAYIKEKNIVTHRGASLAMLYMLKSQKGTIGTQFNLMTVAVRRDPQHAEDKMSCLFNPVAKFKMFVGFICKRNINVMLLVCENEVVDCSSSYSDMSNYYSSVFRDRENINDIAMYDDSAMFATYKKQTLANFEAWFKANLNKKQEEFVHKVLGRLEYIPVLITMIWALFESGKYKTLLKVDVMLDHFEYATTFPVFFKYMCSWVLYRRQRVPLYSVFLGFLMGNSSPLQRNYDYVMHSRTVEEPV